MKEARTSRRIAEDAANNAENAALAATYSAKEAADSQAGANDAKTASDAYRHLAQSFARLAQSYAIGGSGITIQVDTGEKDENGNAIITTYDRDDENKDNAEYYYKQTSALHTEMNELATGTANDAAKAHDDALLARSYAVGGVGKEIAGIDRTEDVNDNASSYYKHAVEQADAANTAADSAKNYYNNTVQAALLAESYTVGNVGKPIVIEDQNYDRTNDSTDNAKYYFDQMKALFEESKAR